MSLAPQQRIIPDTVKVYRRHSANCPYRDKPRSFVAKCRCPYWLDGYRGTVRHNYSLKTRDMAAAVRKMTEIERGESTPIKPLKDAIDAWKRSLHVEESTMRSYRQPCKALLEYCGKARLQFVSDITGKVLEDFRESRKQNLGASSCNRELSILRAMFGWFVARGWALKNPAVQLKKYKVKPSEKNPFTPEEVTRLIAACDVIGKRSYERRRARAMILLLRHTGLRISDAAMLAKNRIRDGKILLWTQKTGGQVYLSVPQELLAALDALPEQNSGYFFWSGRGTRRAAIGAAERMLASVFRKAEFLRCEPHRFRHTLATDILSHGGTIQDVADVLGITPTIAWKHYAKWSRERQERVNRIMELVREPIMEEVKGRVM